LRVRRPLAVGQGRNGRIPGPNRNRRRDLGGAGRADRRGGGAGLLPVGRVGALSTRLPSPLPHPPERPPPRSNRPMGPIRPRPPRQAGRTPSGTEQRLLLL